MSAPRRARQRADHALVALGLAPDLRRAGALIMAGTVFCANRRVAKAGDLVDPTQLRLKTKAHDYVSRGGVKLAAALDSFGIDPTGWTALDLGASTGGFTDVLLRRGAATVVAVDGGTNQLDYRLRTDPRVKVHERCDARNLTPAIVPVAPQIITADLSFISLTTALPAALAYAAPAAWLVALIKPQFELPAALVSAGGIVRDPAQHAACCDKITTWLTAQTWQVIGVIPSPITGHDGNHEFLVAARAPATSQT